MNIQEIRQKYPQYSDIGDRDLLTALHSKFYSDMPLDQFFNKVGFENKLRASQQVLNDPITRGALNPAAGMSPAQRALAGAGKAFTELGGGAAQAVSESSPLSAGPLAPLAFGAKALASAVAPTRQEVQERRDRDVPLMATPAGFIGNLAGGVVAAAPAGLAGAAIPAAAFGGAVLGAAQPLAEGESRAFNTALGAGMGAATQTALSMVRPLQPRAPTVREQTFREGQALGLKTPPSTVTDSWTANRLESVGGKAAMSQEAAKVNQPVVDDVGRKAAGLLPGQDITMDTLSAARDRIAEPYRQVSMISPAAKNALELWKEQNKLSQKWWKAYERLPIPSLADKAERHAINAKNAAQVIENEAIAAGRNDLVPALREARVRLAQNYSVQSALNKGSGEIDASVWGRMLDNEQPITGDMLTVAKFQQAFPMAIREGGRVPPPGVSALEPAAMAGFGMAGGAAGGVPGAIAAGGLPLLRGPMRSFLLSNAVQDALANPVASQGILSSPMMRAFLPPALVQTYLGQQ